MMKKPIILALLAMFTWQANAIDLGKALEETAKQKLEEMAGIQKPIEPIAKVPDAPIEEPNTNKPPTPIDTPTANKPAEAKPIEVKPNEVKTIEAKPAESKPIDTATQTSEAEKPAINWRKPSREEEIAIGREITGSILGAAPLVKDEALQKYVNQVGRWVASQSERPDLPWRFGVIDSADLNAFAMPGGYVLITKGLYANLQNEAQLAGVLGHEIAHVAMKHQLKVMQKQQLIEAGSSWLKEKFGKKNKITNSAIGSSAEISARSLDKNAEFEADRMGVILAARAGYDAYGLPEVLQTMSQIKPTDNSVALLFKTHPHPDERLVKLSEIGDRLDKLKVGKLLENRFYKLK